MNKRLKLNTIYQGDCLKVLKTFSDDSINCVVTSPPYWGLRDYGTATWEGGDADCDHKVGRFTTPHSSKQESNAGSGDKQAESECPKCGAKRIDQQLGLEKTPEEYVSKMVQVFREVKRILKPEGTLWLNLGDSYNSTNRYARASKEYFREGRVGGSADKKSIKHPEIKTKDLVGIPWMVAFALRVDGWYLRQDIIWHKPNPMPESVPDRCTKAHEYIFLMSKSQKYYCDMEAIKEPTDYPNLIGKSQKVDYRDSSVIPNGKQSQSVVIRGATRNKRSVWTVTTKPFPDVHFAVFPPELIVDCIKAGSPENGIVLDPFFGSGTTGEVALRLNRKFIGIELNPEYIKIANKRLSAHLQTLFTYTE